MLNELFNFGRFICPVCGRIVYKPLRGYWCPYCGLDLKYEELVEVDLNTKRLTGRLENGKPYYTGRLNFYGNTLPQNMTISMIEDVLEKLAEYEDKEEELDGEDENSNS